MSFSSSEIANSSEKIEEYPHCDALAEWVYNETLDAGYSQQAATDAYMSEHLVCLTRGGASDFELYIED